MQHPQAEWMSVDFHSVNFCQIIMLYFGLIDGRMSVPEKERPLLVPLSSAFEMLLNCSRCT